MYAEQIPALLDIRVPPFSLVQTPKKLDAVGTEVGLLLEGLTEGLFEGDLVGYLEGTFEGELVGFKVGRFVEGENVGIFEGGFVGALVGIDGTLEGARVGTFDGA